MAWHVHNAQVLTKNADGSTIILLSNSTMEPFQINGTLLAVSDLIAIMVHETVTGSGKPLYTAPDDILYLDPKSERASYSPFALVPNLDHDLPI